MQSAITGHSFPELNWILDEGENTVIFCKTIALGFRIVCYLWSKAAHLPNREKQIRLYNSPNWPTYNSKTLGFLQNNQESSITVATDTLSVGWDSQFTRNAVLVGKPNDVDEFVQKISHIGRDHKAVPNPQAFLYYTRSAMATAQQIVNGEPSRRPRKGAAGLDPAGLAAMFAMDISMAKVFVAECLMIAVDEPYENPVNDPACHCFSCKASPPVTQCQKCNCSRCEPETRYSSSGQQKRHAKTAIPKPPPSETMTKELRIHGTRRLRELRWQIFEDADKQKYGFLSPNAFLLDDLIKTLLDNFHLIKDISDIKQYVEHNPHLHDSHIHILNFCQSL
jgi:hypothetical protein